MAQAIGGRRKLELCLDNEQSLAKWKVEVFPNGDTCASTGDGSTSPVPSTSKTGSLLYCCMMADHK